MSEVASKSICEELYKVSRMTWQGEPHDCVDSSCTHHAYRENGEFIAPKYTAGYLLRKLPFMLTGNGGGYLELSGDEDVKQKYSKDGELLAETERVQVWTAFYAYNTLIDVAVADTPEDALCKLSIELFKSGVIK